MIDQLPAGQPAAGAAVVGRTQRRFHGGEEEDGSQAQGCAEAQDAKKNTAAKRKTAPEGKTAAKKKAAGRRELIDTGTNKLFVRRNERGTSFTRWSTRGSRSPATGGRRPSEVPSGQGDQGDRR